MERRTSRDSVEPRRSCWWASAATAASRSRASARSRLPSTRTRPVDAHIAQGDVEVPRLGGGEAVGLGLLGVEPGLGLLDQPAQLGRADRARQRRDRGVHQPGRVRGQAQGPLGDEPQPPGRQLPGFEPGPAAWEPVAPFDRVGQEPGPDSVDRPIAAANSITANSATSGAAFPTERQAGLVPLIDRLHQRLAGVHRRPHRGGLEHLPWRRPRPVFWPCAYPSTPPGSSAPSSGSGSKVEVIAGPTLPPATDTRRPQIPLSTRDSGCCDPNRDLRRHASVVGRSRRGLRWSRQARPALGEQVPSLRGFPDGRCATSSTTARRTAISSHRPTAASPPAATR